ncbi:hypothetical protein AALB53_09030 [Lachnospiraceae bacterium 47-T17]
MGIGFGEIVILIVVIFVFIKPQDVSAMAAKFAKFVAFAKNEGTNFLNEFKEPADSVIGPIKQVQNEINTAIQEVAECVTRNGVDDGNRND